MAEFGPSRVENNVGKGENADFLLVSHAFQKASSPGSVKPDIFFLKD